MVIHVAQVWQGPRSHAPARERDAGETTGSHAERLNQMGGFATGRQIQQNANGADIFLKAVGEEEDTMICSNCNIAIPEGWAHEHDNKILCEECFVDMLPPARFFDPWVIANPQYFAADSADMVQTDNSRTIIQVLEEIGVVILFC